MSQSDDTFLVATAPRLRHRVRTGDATPATGEAAPRIPDSVPSPSVASLTMLGALRGIDPPYWVRNVPHNGNVKYRTGGFAHFFRGASTPAPIGPTSWRSPSGRGASAW